MNKTAGLHSIGTVTKLSNFAVINDKLTRCRCRLFYKGRNRNYSDLTDEAVQDFIDRKDYANKPVVAHLKKDKDGNYVTGGHDYKITLDNDGNVEYTDETVPFGFIPEDCNPAFEEVVEKSGKVNSYFCTDIILWSHRYPIMEAAYSDDVYFNQSMEISFDEAHEDGDYIVVDKFSLSALCLLNKSNGKDNVEPCFQSAAVLKYSANDKKFKRSFNELLKTYYENNKKGVVTVEMKDKVLKALSGFKYTNALGEEAEKYALISISNDTVALYDRQEGGKTYIVAFSMGENGEVILDCDARVECGLTSCSKEESIFDLSAEIATACDFTTKVKENQMSARVAENLESFRQEAEQAKNALAELKQENTVIRAQLDAYQKADEERAQKAHTDEINKVLKEYEAKFTTPRGRSEFFAYKLKADYSKSADDIRNDMIFMLGKVADGEEAGKQYVVKDTAVAYSLGDKQPAVNKRYGDYVDRVINR